MLCWLVKAQFSGILRAARRGQRKTSGWRRGGEGSAPIGRIMRFLQGIADAGVAGGEDAAAPGGGDGVGGVEGEQHELVHVAADEHVGVELDDAVVLHEAEGRQLGPAVVEARVVAVVDGEARQQVGHALGGDAAGSQGGAAGGREGVGVEGDERVARADGFEAVVERQEAGEVARVRDERGPHWDRGVGVSDDSARVDTSLCLAGEDPRSSLVTDRERTFSRVRGQVRTGHD